MKGVADGRQWTPMSPLQANFLFQLVSQRYEKGSVILTSNKSYGDWGSIFKDNVIASAILDQQKLKARCQTLLGEKPREGIFREANP